MPNWDALYTAAMGTPTMTRYVHPGGSNVNPGTYAEPYQTIKFGLSQLTSGGMLVLKNGTYTNSVDQFVCDTSRLGFSKIPDGISKSRFTIIKGESFGGVVINYTGGLPFDAFMAGITRSSFVWVDSIIFRLRGSQDPSYMGAVYSPFNFVSRCIFTRDSHDPWGGWLEVSASDVLIQDIAATGGCRYGIFFGGPDSTQRRTILRRAILRMDFANTNQPKAELSYYGNDAGPGQNGTHINQNVIIVDGQIPTGAGEGKYGGFYSAKGADNVKNQGCILLNTKASHAGFFMTDWGSSMTSENCVIWDCNTTGITKGGPHNRMTIGKVPSFSSDTTLTNSLTQNTVPSGYIVDNTTGAKILKCYGELCTFHGDQGYDQETINDLWPYAYEDVIKSEFSLQINNPSASYTPAGNVSARGFATGTNIDGTPRTLTKYIWEYEGKRYTKTQHNTANKTINAVTKNEIGEGSVVIGDASKSDNYYPHVVFSKHNLSIGITTSELIGWTSNYNETTETLTLSGLGSSILISTLPNGFDIKISLAQKPLAKTSWAFSLINVNDFLILPSGDLSVGRTLELYDGENQYVQRQNGQVLRARPQRMNNAYYVYMKNKPANVVSDKFGHFEAPKFTDNAGVSLYGSISISGSTLTITAPGTFLDTAQYPVTITI